MLDFIDDNWLILADRASYRDSCKPSKDLRWCPGIYTDPNTGEKSYHDVWLKCFLRDKTPFNTFEELWPHVEFMFERRRKKLNEKQHGTDS